LRVEREREILLILYSVALRTLLL